LAFADSINGDVVDHYKTVINKTPYTVEVCENVAVSGDKTGDTLMGAIIGGAIGNNVTKNVDNGGAVGALLGGMLAHNNSDATGGTKRVCKMETRYNESSAQIYSHSVITFFSNGKQYSLRFNK
jgi:uncharacterized protein YcfJ